MILINVQVLFAGVYLLTQAVVMMLYAKSEVTPPYLHILLTLSKRLHSVYVLRLFNDCWTMLFAYFAVYLLMRRSFAASIATFSLAVSTKMNVLLFAPGVLVACLMVRSPPLPALSKFLHIRGVPFCCKVQVCVERALA
jgi:alpha-1,3-mannosyltransferase